MFLGFIWGASFILMKKGLETFSAVQVAGIRMFVASLITLPLGLKFLKKINKRNILPIMVVAFIGNLIPAFLFSFAQTHINSSLAGMLNSTTPLFALIFGLLLFGQKVRKAKTLGIFIGLLGAFMLVIRGDVQHLFSFSGFEFLIIIATLMYGYNVNQVRHFLSGLSGLEITALAYLFVLPVSTILLFTTDLHSTLLHPQFTVNLIYLIVLAVIGSVLAVILMNMLIQKAGALFASSVTYIIPVFAVFWGIVDGEAISLLQIFGIFTVLTGVYLVNKT
ncbi:MAG TPA: DMT family transporter [Bacteroidales bacterium]|nr:DMT family transporter [Bacteroidales bacterium]HQL70037.1 DMT family transporter [Bacteroidales bacterium]